MSLLSDSSNPNPSLNVIAVLIQALAWPLVALLFTVLFRRRIVVLFDVLIQKAKTAKHLKAGQLEIDAAEEIDRVMNRTAVLAGDHDTQKEIPESHIKAAQIVGETLDAAHISYGQKIDLARKQIYDLADEYEKIHDSEVRGPGRTHKMNEVAAKMRALAVVAYPSLPSLMSGKRPGERLAAICILQVKPGLSHFYWLIERTMQETQSFVFFHASLAILELVKHDPFISTETAGHLVRRALRHVTAARGGKPDQNIVDIFNEVLKRLQNQQPHTG